MGKENKKVNQPALYYQISGFLKKSGVKFQIIDVKPDYSQDKVSALTRTQASQEAKSLVVMGDDKALLVVVGRLETADLSKLKEELGFKNIRMATSEEVKKNTNTDIGAVSPFGNLTGLPVYLDSKLGQEKEIAFSGGLHTKIIVMPFNDFSKIVNPIVGNYTKE